MAKKPKRFTATDGKLVLVLEVAEEGGYCVTSPFVPGLVTQGETLEEAFEMAHDANKLLMQVYREQYRAEHHRNAEAMRQRASKKRTSTVKS